ncbi:ATPase [bacterium]|nr:ATPase [candidate division CSSED10-310 bacterium]
MIHHLLKKHSTIPILTGFLLAIFLGTLLLKLPIATHAGWISWMDALFTATSAVCVTGLVVVDTGSYFTLFGQGTILVLIQIGGLGVMTIAFLFFLWIGHQVTYSQRILLQDLFTHSPRKDILHLISSVAIFTAIAETAGALALYLRWRNVMPYDQALYHAIFHSVSAFCNAGFSLNADSMIRFRSDPYTNTLLCLLITLGGLGFPVLYDLREAFAHRHMRIRLSVQTKAVLLTSLTLVIGGAIAFDLLNRIAGSADVPGWTRFWTAIFQSVTCRTAGFNTIDIASLSDATLLTMIFLMFFGASPGSCGGGVKTTTLAVLIAFVLSRLRGKKRVNLFNKSLPQETVNRSMALIIMAMGIIFFCLLMILAGYDVNRNTAGIPVSSFVPCLFETVSAFGTVGLSMGITGDLNTWGKVWIIVLMIIGRLGVLAFAYLVAGSRKDGGFEYSEENIMIG